MTVEELIKELQKMPGHMKVGVMTYWDESDESEEDPVELVEVRESRSDMIWIKPLEPVFTADKFGPGWN